jgi:hypothetical protein
MMEGSDELRHPRADFSAYAKGLVLFDTDARLRSRPTRERYRGPAAQFKQPGTAAL